MTTDLRTVLDSLGFTEEFGGGEWEKEMGGTFGFRVRVTTHDDFEVPLPQPEVTVALPHQCDAWRVVRNETSHAAALDLMRGFIKEARAAYDILSRLPL